MKIYHLLATQQKLPPTGGDKINEAKLCKAMSKFAEVGYNDQHFHPNKPDYGLEEKEIKVPEAKYDLYYVRNNLEIFKQLPSPRVYLAYPYEPYAFENADAIITTTQIWADRLREYNERADSYDFFNGYYPKEIISPKKIINIGQVLDPVFKPYEGAFERFRYRAMFGFGFVVAYFGRVDKEARPHPDYFAIHEQLIKEIPELSTVIAGNIKVDLPNEDIITPTKIPYAQMPYTTSACDILLCNEHEEANWLASGKTLEAIGCQVPILLTPRPARVEQLGEDYPLYYKKPEQLLKLILRIYRDDQFLAEVKDYLKKRAEYLHIDQHAMRLKEKLSELI